MNLAKLFEMQKALDERIVREKGLEGQDLLPMKILALQVELGELANEWRGFKVWSSDRTMRREKALEEYVDCLHFILSIGLELGDPNPEYDGFKALQSYDNVTQQLLNIMFLTNRPYANRGLLSDDYEVAVDLFIGLSEMLGFTWEEVEQAYIAKNAVNHERQANGY